MSEGEEEALFLTTTMTPVTTSGSILLETGNENGDHEDDEARNSRRNKNLVTVIALGIGVFLLLAFVARKLCIMCKSLRDPDPEPGVLDIGQLANLDEADVLAAAINAQQQRQQLLLQQQQNQQQLKNQQPVGRIEQQQQQQMRRQQEQQQQNRIQCLNCNLIQMGSAVSYADGSCPQCGNET